MPQLDRRPAAQRVRDLRDGVDMGDKLLELLIRSLAGDLDIV